MNRIESGLEGIAVAETRLSHVDGQAGELIIAGYELKELAGKVPFEQAAHLLWTGRLPSAADTEYLLSIMDKPVFEPGKFANYIAPPRRGINQLPLDFQYVRTEQ